MITRRVFALSIFALALTMPSAAHAQLQNGDFENGSGGWTVDPVPPGWSVSFLPSGGHPNGQLEIVSAANDAPRTVCIRQTFECDAPGPLCNCGIGNDFILQYVAPDLERAHVEVWVDGQPLYGITSHDFPEPVWNGIGTVVECGPHEIAVCLRTDFPGPAWSARIDNVIGMPLYVVSVQPATWGRVKATYR